MQWQIACGRKKKTIQLALSQIAQKLGNRYSDLRKHVQTHIEIRYIREKKVLNNSNKPESQYLA